MIYRPTCHYAYHPANDAVLSLHEMFGHAGDPQPKFHILDEDEIVDGIDELGVLLSTAMRKMLTGLAHSFRSRKPESSPRIRMPPVFR